MFDEQEYRRRRDALRGKIRSGLILFPGNGYSPINYPSNAYRFRQDSNFLYFFGLENPGMVGVVDIEGGRDTIYADDLSMDDIIWMGPQPSVRELAARCGVQSTRPMRDLASEVTSALKAGRRVHFLNPYRGEQLLALSDLLGIHPRALGNYSSRELVHAIIALRAVKQPCEVEELDRIAEVGYQMHVTAMRMAQPGVHEQLIAGALEGIAASYGHQTSFATILSQNGETLHNEDHSQNLEAGRLLLVDCGAESRSHYASDNTRTIPIGAKFSEVQLAVYNTVLKALNLGIELAKPGIPYLDIHRAACRVLTEGLVELGVMRGDIDEAVANGAHALFMPHGLGHMMGLDVHDMEGLGEDNVGYDQETQRVDQFGTASLRCGRKLQEGFVVTVEPGIYFIPALIDKWESERINSRFINFEALKNFRRFGGIRLEDDILITSAGCRLLGEKRIPVEPAEVIAEIQKGF